MNPLISAIIPAHNSAQTIAEAIRSILDQTYRNLEIVVVSDAKNQPLQISYF